MVLWPVQVKEVRRVVVLIESFPDRVLGKMAHLQKTSRQSVIVLIHT